MVAGDELEGVDALDCDEIAPTMMIVTAIIATAAVAIAVLRVLMPYRTLGVSHH